MYFLCSLAVLSVDRQIRPARLEITQIYEDADQIQRVVMARALLNGQQSPTVPNTCQM
jgi:hypothetical protein